MTNKVPFFISFKYSAFLTRIRKKCAISEVPIKNRIIWGADSINMWIVADEASRFTNFSNITYYCLSTRTI